MFYFILYTLKYKKLVHTKSEININNKMNFLKCGIKTNLLVKNTFLRDFYLTLFQLDINRADMDDLRYSSNIGCVRKKPHRTWFTINSSIV